MTDRTQAGVWAAEAMLARATKARAKVDFLKNMAKSERSRCRIDRDKIAQRIWWKQVVSDGVRTVEIVKE
jgi:hypothetical protein